MLDVFKALSSPYRLQIIELVYEKERRPHELEKALSMTRGGLERHLKQLVDCGLIEKENFIESGRAKVRYYVSEEAHDYFNKARAITETFIKSRKRPRDNRERIKLLETRIKSLYESIERVNTLYTDKNISEPEYLNIKEGYLKELIEIEKEMARLIQAG
jgi:DNA-binding HxlR family transcriptional regulator